MIALKEDQTPVLSAAQIDGNWKALYGTPSPRIIVAGAITVSGAGLYTVDTEGAAATDDLTSITGATRTGDLVILSPTNDARTIVVKHQGTLHIGGVDFTMDTAYCCIHLRWMGTYWRSEGNFYST